MHREGSEGEREKKKEVLSVQKDEKKGIRGRIESEEEPGGGLVLYPRAEPPALAEPELCRYLNPAICIALFIHRRALVDNQSLPASPKRDGAV